MSQTATITRPPTVHTLSGATSSPGKDAVKLDRLVNGNANEQKDVPGLDSKSGSHDLATGDGTGNSSHSAEECGVGSPTELPVGRVAHGKVERWNYPRGNVPRLAFAFLTFIVAGMNDAAVGVSTMIPVFPYRNEYH